MAESRPLDTVPGALSHSATSSTVLSSTRSRPAGEDQQGATRRRLVSRAQLSAARRRLRRSNIWLSRAQRALQEQNDAANDPTQPVVDSTSSLADSGHPIGDSELLRLTTASRQPRDEVDPYAPRSSWSSHGLSNTSGRISHVVDELLRSVDHEMSRSSARRDGRSSGFNLDEASDRLQQANSDLRLLLEQPLAADPSFRSSSADANSHTGHSVDPDRANRNRFWYGLARPALIESSRTWELDERRDAPAATHLTNHSSDEHGSVETPRKRRKLNTTATTDDYQSNQYCWEGHVVPAKLDLQLVSSDGGIVDCPLVDAATTSYGAENVLKDDASVYCTKASRCNLTLQRRNGDLFTLDSLVIKAPRIGFTDPVQEGLVFLAMRNDRTLAWTAKYPICYLPTSLFASYFPSLADVANTTVSEVELALNPPKALSPSLVNHYQEAGFSTTSSRSNEHVSHGQQSTHTSTAQLPGDGNETESSLSFEHESHEESMTSRQLLEARLQALGRETRRLEHIRTRMGPDWHPEEAEELARLTTHISNRIREIGQAIAQTEVTRRPTSAFPTPPIVSTSQATSLPLSRSSTNNLQRLYGNRPRLQSSFEHVSPVARFRMHQQPELDPDTFRNDQSYLDSVEAPNNNSITIQFDPPLSARYILLKLWSPRHGGNIDIQNISAYGYVGPRFFPAVEKR